MRFTIINHCELESGNWHFQLFTNAFHQALTFALNCAA
jgi:hypothetical protein